MKKSIILILACALMAVNAGAQSFPQAFFLDGYRLGYRYNPALQADTPFLALGQWGSRSRNNIGAESFLYRRGDELVTAFHSSVSAQEFLGNLKDVNSMGGQYDVHLLSYGWKKGPAFHTLEANVRAQYSLSVPKDIFSILKQGTSGKNYRLDGMQVAGNAYIELAYGYSRQLADWVSVGARAKLLVGMESLRYRLTQLDMTFTEQEYRADIQADLSLTSHWNKVGTDKDGYLSFLNLNPKDRRFLPSGAGLALDLGVVLTPLEGLSLSASVTDLGGLFWYYGNSGQSKGSVNFTGLEGLGMDDLNADGLKEKLNEQLDQFKQTLKLKPVRSQTLFEPVPFQANLAVRYKLPFYRALSLGATGNYVGTKEMPYMEAQGVLAWNPWSWLGVVASGGSGSLGPVWGAAVHAAFKNFRLTVGYSNGFGGTIPYTSTPVKANSRQLTAGLTYDL